jgi:hypothetical protein
MLAGLRGAGGEGRRCVEAVCESTVCYLMPPLCLNVRNPASKRLVIRLKTHDLEPIEAIAWFGSRVILL